MVVPVLGERRGLEPDPALSLATIAFLAGRRIGPDVTAVSDIVSIACAFGIASMALTVLAERVGARATLHALHTIALFIGAGVPFAAGLTGWAA